MAAADGADAPHDWFALRTGTLEGTMVALLRFADRGGTTFADLRVHRPGLESVYLALTGRGLGGDAGGGGRATVPFERPPAGTAERLPSAKTA
jgi:hypothetical protein